MTCVGIISGSGCAEWPGLGSPGRREVSTRFGQVAVTVDRVDGVDVVCRVDCLISLTACAELPILVLGYLTDHANGVVEVAEPVEALIARMHAAADVFARVQGILVRVDAQSPPAPVGIVYRFQP